MVPLKPLGVFVGLGFVLAVVLDCALSNEVLLDACIKFASLVHVGCSSRD